MKKPCLVSQESGEDGLGSMFWAKGLNIGLPISSPGQQVPQKRGGLKLFLPSQGRDSCQWESLASGEHPSFILLLSPEGLTEKASPLLDVGR